MHQAPYDRGVFAVLETTPLSLVELCEEAQRSVVKALPMPFVRALASSKSHYFLLEPPSSGREGPNPAQIWYGKLSQKKKPKVLAKSTFGVIEQLGVQGEHLYWLEVDPHRRETRSALSYVDISEL